MCPWLLLHMCKDIHKSRASRLISLRLEPHAHQDTRNSHNSALEWDPNLHACSLTASPCITLKDTDNWDLSSSALSLESSRCEIAWELMPSFAHNSDSVLARGIGRRSMRRRGGGRKRMIVVHGELRIKKNLRTGAEIRKVGGTLISTQMKVEETFVAFFLFFLPCLLYKCSVSSHKNVWKGLEIDS